MNSAEVRTVVKTLATHLVERRNRVGFSQTGVADAMGISRPAVNRLENGHGCPALDTFVPYCDAVGMRIVLVPNVSPERLRAAADAIEELLSGQVLV